jgi:hypothetical protein
LTRIRVQEEPPTEYQRWLEWYSLHCNIPLAREQIRVMPRSRARWIEWLLSARNRDWWLLDQDRLILLTFDADGKRLSAELSDDRLSVARARATWDLAVRWSTPLGPNGAIPMGRSRQVEDSSPPEVRENSVARNAIGGR